MIFFLAFAQYANTITHEYVWDDSIVIKNNEKVQKGIAGIPSLFERTRSNELTDQYGFRPVVLSSYALEVHFWGLNPMVNHFFNVLYFSLLCVLTYLLLNSLFPLNRILCFLITLLFIVHPLHAEVVANIKGRDEIFALLFTVVSFLALLKYVQSNSGLLLAAAVLLFLLGILSKENNLFFAVIIPVSLIWLKNISLNKTLFIALLLSGVSAFLVTGTLTFKLLLIPVVLLMVGVLHRLHGWVLHIKAQKVFSTSVAIGAAFLFFWLIVAAYAYNDMPAVTSEQVAAAPLSILADDADGLYMEDKVLGNPLRGLPHDAFPQLLANSFLILFNYLKLFFYPVSLVYYYGFSYVPLVHWNNAQVLTSVLIYSLLIALLFYHTAHYKELAFATLFCLLSITPYTHVLKILDDYMADRFMFAPSLALCTMVMLVFWKYGNLSDLFAGAKAGLGKRLQTLPLRTVAVAVFLLFSIPLLSMQTLQRNQVWKDNYTLVSSDLPKLANCSRAHYYYANECFNQYLLTENLQAKANFKEATIEHYKKSFSIHKAAFFAYTGLAKAYVAFNEPQNALPVLQEILRLYPHLAISHYQMGHYYYTQQAYEAAIPFLQKAFELRPRYRETYADLAWSYHYVGKDDEAVNVLKKGIEIMPDFLSNYGNLSAIYFDLGQYNDAMNLLLTALKFDPMGEPIYDMIIYQYDERGEFDKAEKYYREAKNKGLLKGK
ncbi:tetratricopeptide repeat protein [Sphingobacteriales bacterium UPWRP_1]|nr:hypothetical protein B6N25_06145 [Sphingobacteriales bacterium TSM_CSS]PSJ78653.1 tetratricopeptide repeat protein [Sphingobacteriales bacterium UPWRP_1]